MMPGWCLDSGSLPSTNLQLDSLEVLSGSAEAWQAVVIWRKSPSVPRLPLDPYAMICPLLPRMGTALPRELPCTDATTDGRSSMKPMY